VPQLQFVLNADFADFDSIPGSFRLGGELSLMQVAFVRLGWTRRESSEIHEMQFGLGVGLVTRWVRFRLDYAVSPAARFGDGEKIEVEKKDDKFGLFVEVPL
jgi:hypothetical protein